MRLEFDARVDARDVRADFVVESGETVAVLGPNGSGKSTVLGVAAGLVRPDRGRVHLGDRTLTLIGEERDQQVPPHRRRISLLAQEPLLFPHLDARDNVAFGPRSAGASRRDSRALAEQLLAEVGAEGLGDAKPGALSGGQAQRVALARALAVTPDLLLLDEPMAALDAAVLPGLRQTLRRVLADRTTVLVTHDVLDALLLADRVVVLEDGRVVEQGPTAEVLGRPRSGFAARLAGLNLVRGRWDGAAVVSAEGGAAPALQGRVAGERPAPGDEVIAAFRPQAVAVYAFAHVPVGSPRNAIDVTLTDVHPTGDLIRVRAGALSADVTPQAVADLGLVPGIPVTFSVKATEVTVYRV